jgi:hypothetical protein
VTVKAAELDRKIEAIEEVVRKGNTADTTKEADPQSASMAKAIGADQDLIAALSHAFFAISIELGSGIGFWLVFGHGVPDRRRLESEPAASADLIDRAGAVELEAIDEKPEDIVARFFFQAVCPRLNGRIQSGAMWAAYRQWCADSRRGHVSHARFGRLARWRKQRVGGIVWYVDCELTEGYAGVAP